MRSLIFFLYVFLGTFQQALSQNSFEKGKVYDSILVSGTTHETFALYLPTSYSKDSLNPAVFIYEPLARGSIGIQPFLKASEKYGLILICSNNSKNGPYETNFAIANNLFNDIFSRFNIADDGIYASGFSGGSRLASAIASLTNKFAGVIGCGAGFSGLQEHMPSAQNYAYVGLCGDRDMNYHEMLTDKEFLKLIKFNSTLITFPGNHRWPPPEQILRAFDWLYLQKIKKESSKNLAKILEYYNNDYALLLQFLKDGELLFAAEQYERLTKDYKGFIQNDSLVTQHSLFKKSPAYKKKVASLEASLKVEEKYMEKFRSRFSEEFENTGKINFKWWEKELAKLKSLKEKEDVEIQKMVNRVEYDLFARAYVRKNLLLQTPNTEQVPTLNRLLRLIYPKLK